MLNVAAGFADELAELVDVVDLLEPPPQPARITAAMTVNRVFFGKPATEHPSLEFWADRRYAAPR
jgi:hypothetical protein